MRSSQITAYRLSHHVNSKRRNRLVKLRRAVGQKIEGLEPRRLLSVSWQTLSASGSGPGDGGGAMNLLGNGQVLIQDGGNPGYSSSVFTLSPQNNTGSYVNGSWNATGSLHETRLF